MKMILMIAVFLTFLAGEATAQERVTPKTQKEKISYTFGINVGKNIKMQEIDLDLNILIAGIKDAINDSIPVMTETEMNEALNALQYEMRTKAEIKQKTIGEKNKKEGEAFLAENKKKKDIVTLPSGLQYRIIKKGNGPKPKADQTVKCNYKGTLIDGTEFDSSFKRGTPAEFPVGQVIKGWTEALQLMPTGSTWQLFIPSDLAYGEHGAGKTIGPNATLIFEVELLSIK
jgi:FKBP-type peptidyl-prolyl cis-trans isomerase FklB